MFKKLSILFVVLAVLLFSALPGVVSAQITHTIVVLRWDNLLWTWVPVQGNSCVFSVQTSNENPIWETEFDVMTDEFGIATTEMQEVEEATEWIAICTIPNGFTCVPIEGWEYVQYPNHTWTFYLQPE
jgi:hypothetical protein